MTVLLLRHVSELAHIQQTQPMSFVIILQSAPQTHFLLRCLTLHN